MNLPSVNNLCDCHYINLLSLGYVSAITSIILVDHMLPLDCLPFWGTFATSGPISHPLHITMFWEVPRLPRTSFYPGYHSFLKKWVSFKLFSNSLNMKRLSRNWPLQLTKVIGSAIPHVYFKLFRPEGLSHENVQALVFFGSLKWSEKSSLSYYFILFRT